MKFKEKDIIKCTGEYFATREIVKVDKEHNKYVTKFLDDGSIVESDIHVTDKNYWLVEGKT